MTEPVEKLEYKLLFAIVVAGKTARHARAAMDRLRGLIDGRFYYPALWFPAIRELDLLPGQLADALLTVSTGNYRRIERGFREAANSGLDLATCSLPDLEAIHGIGMKSSRFFFRWTGRSDPVAVLDTHILAWLAEQGYHVPERATPSSRARYLILEECFIAEAAKLGKTPADLDNEIWLERNRSGIRS